MVVGVRQSFQFLRQMTWFLGRNNVLSKLRYWIQIFCIAYESQSVRANFYVNLKFSITINIYIYILYVLSEEFQLKFQI